MNKWLKKGGREIGMKLEMNESNKNVILLMLFFFCPPNVFMSMDWLQTRNMVPSLSLPAHLPRPIDEPIWFILLPNYLLRVFFLL